MGLIYDVRRAMLAQNNLIVVDAEKEYTNLCKALGGTMIELNPGTASSVNILDIGPSKPEQPMNIH